MEVPLAESYTDDKIEILSIVVSKDEKFMALFTGKNLIKEEEEIHQLFVYEISPHQPSKKSFRANMIHEDARNTDGNFKLIKKVDFPPKYRSYSKMFCFLNGNQEKYIVMLDQKHMVKFNYLDEQETQIFEYKKPLNDQPDFCTFDEIQKIAVIASSTEAYLINLNALAKGEICLETKFDIKDIKTILYDDGSFYILANKLKE